MTASLKLLACLVITLWSFIQSYVFCQYVVLCTEEDKPMICHAITRSPFTGELNPIVASAVQTQVWQECYILVVLRICGKHVCKAIPLDVHYFQCFLRASHPSRIMAFYLITHIYCTCLAVKVNPHRLPLTILVLTIFNFKHVHSIAVFHWISIPSTSRLVSPVSTESPAYNISLSPPFLYLSSLLPESIKTEVDLWWTLNGPQP